MSHENSITIQNKKGKWVNIKGNVKGKFAPRKAEQLYRQGQRKPLGGKKYNSVKEAEKAAKERSKSFDKKKPH